MKQRFKEFFAIITQLKNWYLFFENYLKINYNKHKLFQFRNGLLIIFRGNPDDASIIKEVAIMDFYNTKSLNLGKEPVIIDIGGHIGTFSMMMAHNYPQGRIIIAEPMPENYEIIKKNIYLNQFKNIDLYDFAISNKNDTLQFNLYDNKSAASLYKQPNEENTESIQVKSVTLSHLFQCAQISRCDYLKLDCEGAEFDILLDSSPEVLEKIKHIGLEYHDAMSFDKTHLDIEKKLKQAGFYVTYHKSGFPLMYASRI